MRKSLIALTVASAVALPTAASALESSDRAEVEAIVEEYLMQNPDILVRMSQKLQEMEEKNQQEQAKAAIVGSRDDIFNDANDPFIGNSEGDVVVVEFMDYNCGYCKKVNGDVKRLVEEDAGVLVRFKEFPILGPGSLVASRAALAADKQGKYAEMHDALMEAKGIDEDKVFKVAEEIGLDIGKLKEDMASPDVQAEIDANITLAQKLGVRGTPAFLIGDKLLPGAVPYEKLQELVDETRAAAEAE